MHNLEQHDKLFKHKRKLTVSARCNGQNILIQGGGFLLVWHELNGGSILLSYSRANASLHKHPSREVIFLRKGKACHALTNLWQQVTSHQQGADGDELS